MFSELTYAHEFNDKYMTKSFLGNLTGHENRITSLSVAENGLAVATCSWDQGVRVWG